MIRFAGCRYPIHPLAMDLPPLVPERYARLLASIIAYGLMHPVTDWQGRFTNGVHRLRACTEAGRELRKSADYHAGRGRQLLGVSPMQVSGARRVTTTPQASNPVPAPCTPPHRPGSTEMLKRIPAALR